jgi:hypothetical protein
VAVWAKLLESSPPQTKASIAQALKHWQEDTDLTGIRDDKAVEALPEPERAAWHRHRMDMDQSAVSGHMGLE